MNEHKERRKRWVDALRSGEYQQCTEALRKGDAFCCLGVACDLHAKETGGEWVHGCRYLGQEYELPIDVMVWFGLRSPRGDFAGETLAELNDDGTPFSEIASIIESEPEGLFVD